MDKVAFKKKIRHFIRRIGQSAPVVYMIGMTAFIYSWLVGKTSHFEIHGEKEFDEAIANNNGLLFITWHGRALMLPYFWRNTRQLKAIVSPHADGRIIATMLRNYNILSIDGSSDKQAVSAAIDIVKELNKGTVVAVIPDGPRGPRMRLKKSVMYFAQKTGKPIMGFTYSMEKARVMRKSWDAMLLPRFGTRGVIYGTKPMFVPADATEEEKEILQRQFEDELNELTYKADKECGIDPVLPGDTKHRKKYRKDD